MTKTTLAIMTIWAAICLTSSPALVLGNQTQDDKSGDKGRKTH